MARWLLRRILGEHTAHALECDSCFDSMISDFVRSL